MNESQQKHFEKLKANSELPLTPNDQFVMADKDTADKVTKAGQEMITKIMKNKLSNGDETPTVFKVEKDGNVKTVNPSDIESPLKKTTKRKITPSLNIGTIGDIDFSKTALTNKPSTKNTKGDLGAVCYRTVCDKAPALYFNKSTKKHYCVECATMINDACRSDAYNLFGAELCEIDESLTPKDLEMYHAIDYPTSPAGSEMSPESLMYQSKMNEFRAKMNDLNEDIYDTQVMTKEDRKYAGKAIEVTPKTLIGRNDPCSCGSGKKFKKCCLNK